MHVKLDVITSEEYFLKLGQEIDWEENDNTKISINQQDEIAQILTTEASIYLLRRATGLCGSLVDNMVIIRRDLINEYEYTYGPYVEYNDFL